jgi:alpha-beta hydrolase superfamily lysophospholipase
VARDLVARFGGERTFEIGALTAPSPRGVAVLLHGLSDSPYSLRGVGEVLTAAGWEVIALRLPGHGTVPAGLLDATWLDWRDAVELAVREADRRAGGRLPLLLAGYSNGAALSLDYALRALDDPELPRPARLVFLSPGFAVPGAAAAAPWLVGASRLPGLERLAWTDLLPEFDPFKYNSFPVNAGAQIYHLTTAIEARLAALEKAGRLGEVPPVLCLQSVVDSTIAPLPSLRRLFGRLRGAGNELVLFDVNRLPGIEALLRSGALELTQLFESGGRLERASDIPFTLTLVTNVAPDSLAVEARTRAPGREEIAVEPLDLAWPPGLFSLAHVAVPFPPDDPAYGREPGGAAPFPLGRFEARGETRTLRLPSDLLVRQRYNPFFPYLAARLTRFVGGSAPPVAPSGPAG